jgi:hypothetical protein
MARLKPLLTTLAVTGALVGGGAAVASAATSTSTTSTGSSASSGTTGSTGATGSTAPARAGSGASHNCPNM